MLECYSRKGGPAGRLGVNASMVTNTPSSIVDMFAKEASSNPAKDSHLAEVSKLQNVCDMLAALENSGADSIRVGGEASGTSLDQWRLFPNSQQDTLYSFAPPCMQHGRAREVIWWPQRCKHRVVPAGNSGTAV